MLRETLACLNDTGTRVLDVEIIKLDRAPVASAFKPAFEVAAALGARNVLVTSDTEDLALNRERLAALCEIGSQFGLHFHVEFMPWARGVQTLQQAEAIVSGAGARNAHIMVDAIHFDRTGATLFELAALPPERFQYFQLCDAPRQHPSTAEGVLEQGRFERLFPGEGGLNLQGLLTALPAGIPVSLEAPKRHLRAVIGDRSLAKRGNEALRGFLDVHRSRNSRCQD